MRLLAPLLLFAATASPAQTCGSHDTLYTHGHILTGVGLDEGRLTWASAMRVRDGIIAEIGNTVTPCQGARVVDLHNRFVMPGFNDAHTHMAFAGQQRMTVDLDNVASLGAMQAKVKAFAATLPPGAWITGGGWDHTKWASGTLPTRQDLDAVSGGHPAYLERTDGHIAVLNSAALQAAGITRDSKAPQGGSIDLDASGEPTGIVRDTALAPVRAVLPKPDAAMRRKALAIAMQDAASHGVTSVQDFSDWDDFLVLEQMEKDGELKVRWSEWLDFNLPVEKLKELRAHHDQKDPWLHTGMLKGFMDGSLGSRTAAMAAPYSDDPKNSGLPRYDQTKLNAMATERAAAGFQLGFHAIGDRANTMALDAIEAAEQPFLRAYMALITTQLAAIKARPEEPCNVARVRSALEDAATAINPRTGKPNPAFKSTAEFGFGVMDCYWRIEPKSPRNRIEHAQVVLPADFIRFGNLRVIASMQPSHLLTDMAWAEQRLGPERSKYAYAWRSMLDHHITLAFGTDYPVESIDPMRGLYAATTRSNVEGTQTFHPEQKLTMTEALYAYTAASAFAEFAEDRKAILAPGHLADFVVLDHNLTTTTGRDILSVKVLRTVVGGKTMYQATTAPTPPTRLKPADE